MPVKERLIEFIHFKEMSIRHFCKKIGVSETYVNSMRSSIKPDKLMRIVHAFPDINTEWLLTGDGNMLKENQLMPQISREELVNAGSDIFKDKLIEMFTKGEIFSATIVWEQHRMIHELVKKNEDLTKENETLKILLAQHGIGLP